jgi:hypothetical protein
MTHSHVSYLIDWPVVVHQNNYWNMTLLFGNSVTAFQMQLLDRTVWHSYSWNILCVFWLVVCSGFIHKQGPVLLDTLILNVQLSIPRIVFWASCKKWQWDHISHYSSYFLTWLTKGFVLLWTFPKHKLTLSLWHYLTALCVSPSHWYTNTF